MPRWSVSRKQEWSSFARALARMGALLKRRKTPAGVYAPKRETRHPLLEAVMNAAEVVSAIGTLKASDVEERGVLSWVSIAPGEGGTTIRLNHKGTKERSQKALEAAISAIRKLGRRVSYYDLIRHENQNGYLALLRVPDASPALGVGFAR